jgi:hypothetical protein
MYNENRSLRIDDSVENAKLVQELAAKKSNLQKK